MKVINITPHTIDTQLSLENEYKNDSSDDCILLCAYNLKDSIEQIKQENNHIIVFNQEQPSSPFFTDEYINILKNADSVWDYDEYNIEYLHSLGISNVEHHILKPFIEIPEQEKEFDVCFYGALNDRRVKILNDLVYNELHVVVPNGLFGDDLNECIAKSKCLLNIHFYTDSLQEQARLIRWIGNGKIFSEKSRKNYLNIDEYEYDELVPQILEYIKNIR